MLEAPLCLECETPAELFDGRSVYPHRNDLFDLWFWVCPTCTARCGCHPDTQIPLGRPAGPETRKARSRAHAEFDTIWKSGIRTRQQAYNWLARTLSIQPTQCHIGNMTAEEARCVLVACRAVREWNC